MIGYDNGVRGTYIGMKGGMTDVGVTVMGTKAISSSLGVRKALRSSTTVSN